MANKTVLLKAQNGDGLYPETLGSAVTVTYNSTTSSLDSALGYITQKFTGLIKQQQITLSTASWSSKIQTVTMPSDFKADTAAIVTPAPSSQDKYLDCNVKANSQSNSSLVFTCDTVPSEALTVNVLYFVV